MNATPTAQTPDHLRNAGNLCSGGVPVVTGNAEQDAFLRVAELERENAKLTATCAKYERAMALLRSERDDYKSRCERVARIFS